MVNIFRYVGIGKEAQFATPVAATIFLDPTNCTLDAPPGSEIMVEGGMGRMLARKRRGFYSCAGAVEYPVDINSIGYLLRGALDQYVFTSGGGGLNTHEFYGGNDNQLESFTYRIGKDIHEHIFPGCMVNSLKISVADRLAMATVDLFGAQDDTDTLKTYSDIQALIPTQYPMAFYNVTAEVNSSDVSAICRSVDLTIANTLGRDSGRSIGSMFPATFKASNRVVDVVMQLQFEDLTHQTLFWGDAGGPDCGGSTPFPLTLDFDGDTDGELIVDMPNAMMVSAPQQPRGRDPLYQTITCRAMLAEDVLLNDAITTVDTDILCTLQNNLATLA